MPLGIQTLTSVLTLTFVHFKSEIVITHAGAV